MRQMLFITLLAACNGCCAAAAPASPSSTVAAAFGNTIVSTYPDGRKAETWLKADGSYTALGRRRDASNGHWSLKGSKVCFKQTQPFPTFFSFCVAFPAEGLSAAGFPSKAFTGEMTTITLVHGHVTPG